MARPRRVRSRCIRRASADAFRGAGTRPLAGVAVRGHLPAAMPADMKPPLLERRPTLAGVLTALVGAFALLVALARLTFGADAGRYVLAYGGCGLLLAFGEIGFALAANRWLGPARAARLALVAMPLLALACYAWVRLIRGALGVPLPMIVAWVLFGTWSTWHTWRRLARGGASS